MCVTLLAVTCMLGRAVLPMPAAARGGNAAISADLSILGAALCHSDDGSDDSQRPGMPFCDHCPVCGHAIDTPFPLAAGAAVPRPFPVTDARPAVPRHALAQTRAPPEHAHQPRAPPAV